MSLLLKHFDAISHFLDEIHLRFHAILQPEQSTARVRLSRAVRGAITRHGQTSKGVRKGCQRLISITTSKVIAMPGRSPTQTDFTIFIRA